jgi:DNA replication protein DnaC
MPTSNKPRTAICESCRSVFIQEFVVFNGKEIFHSRNCEPCCEAHNARTTADPAKLEAERRRAFLEIEKVPKTFRDTDRSRLNPVLIQAIEDYRFSDQGLAFIGKSGAGKTRAMMSLVERLAGEGKSVAWMTSTDISYLSVDQFSNDPQEKHEARERLKRLRTVKVAFIDDLGKGRLTDRVESELFDIIDTRTREGRPTFWTSNSSGRNLFAMFSPDRAEALMRRIGKDFTKIISL